ncbi:aminodeoxychorismate synthase component I [Kordiimonas aestuarii]|uniref:aminodeoxychorismate synthase component I n=1 Tax=Kordiimonas aestuarii TaxID=1005925 RepID=UPI0021CE2588|nr:aminodeoxychorismate synthase component I [Kordiimonas aestuarii]
MSIRDLRQAPFVLLDDSRPPHRAGRSVLFHSPDDIITAHRLEEVGPALARMDDAVARGYHLAGWIGYECAAYFEPRIKKRMGPLASEPLLWMLVTRQHQSLTAAELNDLFHASHRGSGRPARLEIGTPKETSASYASALNRIHDYIAAGDVYQINHTFVLPVNVEGDALTLYERLRQNQPVPYGAFIDTGDRRVLSLSPELFVERHKTHLACRPMKGTAPRGRTTAEDQTVAGFLRSDSKSRAENLMIVDLIRNDLSRIAKHGSVKVPALFEVEKYPTLHQMTSTVTADAPDDLTPSELLAALFPCGSVTGAPKVRAMEIINELEHDPRGVYCGAIGHFSPETNQGGPRWSLNVPIRTIVLDSAGHGRLSIGSGVVADSDTAAEYEECLLKARFAREDADSFSLIETLRLDTDGTYARLDRHLTRLADSAAYFDFTYDDANVREVLADHAAVFSGASKTRRVRLLVGPRGSASVTSTALPAKGQTEARVCIARQRTRSADRFLAHKTTRRQTYDGAFAQAFSAGYADTVFFNERNELTEGAISTVFIVEGGKWYTPPLDAGVLPGILRAELLASDEMKIIVEPISRRRFLDADEIYIGNSVRGLRRVTLDITTR